MVILLNMDIPLNDATHANVTPEPSILQPHQEARFSKEFTSDNIGNHFVIWILMLPIYGIVLCILIRPRGSK
jgi:hypothetical protein